MKNCLRILIAVICFALTACGDGSGGKELSGNITISGTPTTGTLLTAAYSGKESVSFQWKRGSANVETGASFRPLKSGELTVTVSAIGYESKSDTVTVTGETANMFWWGNYIPDTAVQTTNVSSSVFILNELVANRENARKRLSLPSGQPTTNNNIILNQDGTIYGIYNITGVFQGTTTTKNISNLTTLRWEEKKNFETASNSQNKQITYESALGFAYFISPKSYGDLKIQQGPADVYPPTGIFDKAEKTFDSVEYYIYRYSTANATATTPIFIFKFTN